MINPWEPIGYTCITSFNFMFIVYFVWFRQQTAIASLESIDMAET
jgi:hypothetical protein